MSNLFGDSLNNYNLDEYNPAISFHGGGGGERDKNQVPNVVAKILSIVIILSMTVLFGFFPYFCKRCRKSVKILGLANAFSGGIFLGIALFHLLPESVEGVDEYFEDKDTFWKKLPLSYFLAFLAYALILFVEKIAFDSHSLIEHDHGEEGHSHAHGHGHAHDQAKEVKELEVKKEKKQKKESGDSSQSSDSDSDLEEETMRNVISSKGKFASFLHMRNSMIEKQQQTKSFADNSNNRPLLHTQKKDKALTRASMLLRQSLSKSFRDPENEDLQFLVNPSNVHVEEKNTSLVSQEHPQEFKPKSNLTPFLLLIALSLHGLFEGIALGIMGTLKDTIFLFIAIVAHKWAEAFTLGISFTKANTDKKTFIWLIIIFALFTPVGIGIGLIISGSNSLIEGIFLGISTGTFIYVAASEVIVEEFAVTKYRYSKYILFLIGGIFVAGLAIMEKVFEEGGHDHDHDHDHLLF